MGDLAKLLFEYDGETEQWSGERMWVEVTNIDAPNYHGTLVNYPDEPHAPIKFGDQVSFNGEDILDVLLIDEKLLPNVVRDPDRYPQVPNEREYWERCLVDECVLSGDVPVEYLYREEPEPGQNDEYPDSGWRIRGKEMPGDDMDEREAAYVALGAVLNRDDSWLHLIDAPIGSAFMRNFETGVYEPSN